MTDWNQYIGIPFKDKGRTGEGCDCWGLIRLIYKRELDIQLPSYDDRYFTTIDRHLPCLFDIERRKWKRVEIQQPGDVVLFRIYGKLAHCGIVVKPDFFIHSWRATCSVMERLNHPFWRNRVEGFYRYHPAYR